MGKVQNKGGREGGERRTCIMPAGPGLDHMTRALDLPPVIKVHLAYGINKVSALYRAEGILK